MKPDLPVTSRRAEKAPAAAEATRVASSACTLSSSVMSSHSLHAPSRSPCALITGLSTSRNLWLPSGITAVCVLRRLAIIDFW